MPTYIDPIRTAFIDMWASVLSVLPQILAALLVLLLGVLIAGVLKEAVIRLINLLKVDEVLSKTEIPDAFERSGFEFSVANLLGWIVKWFVIILALITSADILGWQQVTFFLNDVISYVPNVIIAVIVLLVGMLLGSFVQNVITGAFEAAEMRTGNFLAGLAKWAIIVFSFMAALVQLGIAQALIQVLFTGFVAMLALAGGLAFGLGGKEHAARILNYIEEDFGGGPDYYLGDFSEEEIEAMMSEMDGEMMDDEEMEEEESEAESHMEGDMVGDGEREE